MLSATGAATPRSLELPILGYAGPATKQFSRTATGRYAETFPAATGVPAAVCAKKPITVTAATRTVRLVQTFSSKVKFTVQRDNGADGEIKIESIPRPIGGDRTPLPNGVSGGTATIKKDTAEAEIELTAGETVRPTRQTWLLGATTTVAGEPVTVILPKMTLEIVRPFAVEILTAAPPVVPGGETKLVGLVRREPQFKQEVTIAMRDLPPTVTAEPVTVTPDQVTFEMVIGATDKTELGDIKAILKATTHMPGRKQTKDYELPDLETQLEVVKEIATQPAKAE
jgi:hypothetical protein